MAEEIPEYENYVLDYIARHKSCCTFRILEYLKEISMVDSVRTSEVSEGLKNTIEKLVGQGRVQTEEDGEITPFSKLSLVS